MYLKISHKKAGENWGLSEFFVWLFFNGSLSFKGTLPEKLSICEYLKNIIDF